MLAHAQRLIRSYRHWFDRDLLPPDGTPLEQAQRLYPAPFAVLSHGTEADPILNYGNATALRLWEASWDDFVHMPSRLTTEPELRELRRRLMAELTARGSFAGMSGRRISRGGRRFQISDASLWDVLTENGEFMGQAATFSKWQMLDEDIP